MSAEKSQIMDYMSNAKSQQSSHDISDVKVECLRFPKAFWHLFYMCVAATSVLHPLILLVLVLVFNCERFLQPGVYICHWRCLTSMKLGKRIRKLPGRIYVNDPCKTVI